MALTGSANYFRRWHGFYCCFALVLFIYPTVVVGEFASFVDNVLERVRSGGGDSYCLAQATPGEVLALKQVYEKLQTKQVWPPEAGVSALQYLQALDLQGLRPETYCVHDIASSRDQEVRDVVLTLGLGRFLLDQQFGVLRGRATEENFSAVVLQAHGAGRQLESFLHARRPFPVVFDALVKEFELLADDMRHGGWPTVDVGRGDALERVHRAVPYLVARGYVASQEAGNEELLGGVRRFQALHGLEQDGVIGRRTLEAMHVSALERRKQVIVNLERLRSMQRVESGRYLVVNIPAFTAMAIEDGSLVFTSKVIVGKRSTPTPILYDYVEYVEVNPYWHVPRSIVLGEFLPELRSDVESFAERGISVFSVNHGTWEPVEFETVDWSKIEPSQAGQFRFRQDPGPRNALGHLKIVFPNHADVYMHDTPTRQLFSRAVRLFSHGCIRAEAPYELASFLLRTHSPEDLKALVETGTRRVLTVEKQVPINVVYQTVDGWGAMVRERVRYLEDVYGWDAALWKRMVGTGKVPAPDYGIHE